MPSSSSLCAQIRHTNMDTEGEGRLATAPGSRIEVFARIRPSSSQTDVLTPSVRRINFSSVKGIDPKKDSSLGLLSVEAGRNGRGFPTVVTFERAATCGDERFEMDGVFDASRSQRDVFNEVGVQLVSSVIDGFNSTIFAYGRTSSGKTHTITGPITLRSGSDSGWSLRELERESADPAGCPSQLGLVPRALHALLRAVEVARDGRKFTACFACAEIYQRSLFDLCTDDGGRTEVKGAGMSASAAERLTWHHVDLRAGREDEAMLAVQASFQLLLRSTFVQARVRTFTIKRP